MTNQEPTTEQIKLKRISDKEIYDITGGWWLREGKTKNVIDELIPIPETHNHYLRKCVAIAQAQLEQDQKRVDELVGEIFGEIDGLLEPTFRGETPMPIPSFYIRETKLQALKQRFCVE